ncbi:eukaryotic translation initiation factor 2-alpha kinase eif2-alpha kinase -related [Anaeramoeba ignava]|uniref:non-specific serine/threonine protein kinase n=1 Tax=Anaeramoeba ignava TaxID=1746090 RepID=A0A9Q0LR57_ANAIG|nr:eukaryotic translation initiation factor 2-alpha kinase eif2-alpha kinase -related [Anaeramoeba ignava]|eukprot:Anaeramoba_ignava/c12763_g1_i1.p1 GENE.c12763_g1_i1~~c12763_g1_i1.p1  ORF type:complete len:212 (+),score=72.84 c12763_g1_i1:34-669(+)
MKKQLKKQLDLQFISSIGGGCFGKVFKIVHSNSKQVYALKVFRKNEKINKQEIETMQSFQNHPNIVRFIKDISTQEIQGYLMEFCPFGSLSSLVQKNSKFLEKRKLRLQVMKDIVNGVLAIHERGLVIQDLKMDNILISSDFTAKLCDLGLAQIPDEQENVTFNNDIFYLGLIFAELGFLEFAELCSQKDCQKRPSILEVAEKLKNLDDGL